MSSSDGSEEENDDVFEMGQGPLDASGQLPSVRSAPPGSLRERGQPAGFNPSKRRGSVIVLGGKESSVSIAAEVAATIKRMEEANASNDINQMQSALNAAGSVAAMAGPGDPSTVELQMMAMKVATRISGDESLRKTGALRRSRAIREEIRRLWDLMESESARIANQNILSAEGAAQRRPEVTRDGYSLMHMCISRALCDPNEGLADERKARALADKDWTGDISRFSGTSHIVVWLASVREKFREACTRAVLGHGFGSLFKQYDSDGSGELDQSEFEKAVRSDLGVDETQLSTKQLKQLFRAVDADGSGEVNSEEFTQWLFKSDRSETKALSRIKNKFRAMSEHTTTDMGWQFIFDRYDDDNSGELDVEEFTSAVRMECSLDEDAITDDEIKELFGVIDTDQGGGIDKGELLELLDADLDQASITFGAFYSSVFELAEIWAHDEDVEDPAAIEESYVKFLRAVFNATAVPRDHVKHFSAAELDTIEVFEDAAKTRPNFELRPFDSIETLVQADGSISLTGLRNGQDNTEPEGEIDLSTPTVPTVDVQTTPAVPTVDVQTLDESPDRAGTTGEDHSRLRRLGTSSNGDTPADDPGRRRKLLAGSSDGRAVFWSPVEPKVFALHEPSQSRQRSELEPAAARRKGCWVNPWQVRFAHRPPGGAGAFGATRGGSKDTTTGKPVVRVTRSKFLDQYNHTPTANSTSPNRRRHGPLKEPQYGMSSQEYWAARRALLIEIGVRATTSAQVASSRAVQRQQQIAAVKAAGRRADLPRSPVYHGERDFAAARGGRSTAEVTAIAIARQQKERIEKVVSPFSPKVQEFALSEYDDPPESDLYSQQRPQTAPEQHVSDAMLARPKTAPEGIERVSMQGIAHPETEHMLSSTKYANQNRNAVSARERVGTATPTSRTSSSVLSPKSPLVQKTPRQVQSARDRRARAATSKSGVISSSPVSVTAGRRGLDPVAIARGQTRPTATPPAPLFLPLSPREFDGWAGTSLEKKLKKGSRSSRTTARPRKAHRSPSETKQLSERVETPSPVAGSHSASTNGRATSHQHRQAADTSTRSGAGTDASIVQTAKVTAPARPLMPCSPRSPCGVSSPLQGSRSRLLSSVGADLRCYVPASSKFISLA